MPLNPPIPAFNPQDMWSRNMTNGNLNLSFTQGSLGNFAGIVQSSAPAVTTSRYTGANFLGFDSHLPPLTFGSVDLSDVGGSNAQLLPFKRPLTGIYPVHTPATIMVMSNVSNNSQKKGNILFRTNKFILMSITKPHQEKFQVIETFGKSHVFFYDERTKIYTMNGVMLDAFYQTGDIGDNNTTPITDDRYRNMWALGFQEFYNKHLRGYQLKKAGNIAAMYTNGWLIKGYPIQLTISKESTQMPEAVSFQFTWVIEDEILLNSNAKGVSQLYNGIDYGTKGQTPSITTMINELQGNMAEYQRLLNEYNNATDPDIKQDFKTKYEAMEVTITGQQKALDDVLGKKHSIQDLNME